MRPWISVVAAAGLAACSGSTSPAAAGPDGGPAGGPTLSDGGGLGAACTSLDQCAGNAPCTSQACSFDVICANGACASAGGALSYETVKVAFSGTAASPLPTYLQVYVLAPALVGSSATLDCPTLLGLIDAGTLNPDSRAQVNPLIGAYDQSVTPGPSTELLTFATNAAASGAGRVLFLEGYLDIGEPDGGAELLARGCATFDNTGADAGTVSLTLSALW